jgi:glutamate synthase domain-containing protein 1
MVIDPRTGRQLIADKDYRIPSACGVTGIMNEAGQVFSGSGIVASICNMLERGNGLGSGYAGYGIYPEHKDQWCFHVMYQKATARPVTEAFLARGFKVVFQEPIPTKYVPTLKFIPELWRYFLDIKEEALMGWSGKLGHEDLVVKTAMEINRDIEGAFVFSSGKNMGIFKGVGHPDEIAAFYDIPSYRGYIWTAHNRFPTNSVGWWGGAHPFGILDWSVVHNGEISSYGINRRYLENHNYYCTLQTDTEVIAYLFDLLVRKHALDFETAGKIMAAPFWRRIDRLPDGEEKTMLKALRTVYGSALVNGPFAVIVANNETMVGLNDRVKLRPLVAARKGDVLYLASEEASIRVVSRELDTVWMPDAGVPTIGRLRHG